MMNPGMTGAIIGGIGGLAGGVIGAYAGIKNTNGPKERGYMIKMAALMWWAVVFFLALLFALPTPYQWFIWGPWVVLLVIGITYCNKRQGQIRKAESQENAILK
jgi:Ca2+/Na+ antiporter